MPIQTKQLDTSIQGSCCNPDRKLLLTALDDRFKTKPIEINNNLTINTSNASQITRAILQKYNAVNADYKEELFCSGINEKGSILKHPDLLDDAFKLGERVAPD